MGTATTTTNTQNQLTTNYDFSEVFLGKNTFNSETFINISGGVAEYGHGTVVGRISASGKITACVAAATDGSQNPLGVLASDTGSLADDGETNVSVCDFGEVAQEKLIFNASETLSTAVGGRQMRDLIPGNSRGIKLIASTDLTNFDN